MGHHRSKHAYQVLSSQIEEALQRKASTLKELSRNLGFSHHAIRVRLIALMAAGRVHYVAGVTSCGRSIAHVWHPGPASKEQMDELHRKLRARAARPDRGPISTPSQVTTSAFPVADSRDPLVAAFFGRPRQAAA